jgi:enoyl-CoA hydratase
MYSGSEDGPPLRNLVANKEVGTVGMMETIRIERDGDVLIATIDHPRSVMNAVDAVLHREFAELFASLKREGEARAIVLTGSGRAFSAGGDMAWFPALRAPDRLHELRREAKQLVWDLLDVEVPIVCGLNGSAAGLGASIALLCDVIVMADTASIVDPHVHVGLVAGDGGAAIWPLLVGPLAAKRHLLLGEPLGADEALRLGVAAQVCVADDVAATARSWADRLAAQPPLALQGTKIAMNAQLKQALLTSFDLSTALEMPCFQSADHAEAIAAFVEKRPGIYHGR